MPSNTQTRICQHRIWPFPTNDRIVDPSKVSPRGVYTRPVKCRPPHVCLPYLLDTSGKVVTRGMPQHAHSIDGADRTRARLCTGVSELAISMLLPKNSTKTRKHTSIEQRKNTSMQAHEGMAQGEQGQEQHKCERTSADTCSKTNHAHTHAARPNCPASTAPMHGKGSVEATARRCPHTQDPSSWSTLKFTILDLEIPECISESLGLPDIRPTLWEAQPTPSAAPQAPRMIPPRPSSAKFSQT